MGDLKRLKEHDIELLLAEAAALLHDLHKSTEEHVRTFASDGPPARKRRNRQNQQDTYNLYTLSFGTVKLLGALEDDDEGVELERLVKFWGNSFQKYLQKALLRCHHASHIEKEETDYSGQQPASATRPSSPFGYEADPVSLPELSRGAPELVAIYKKLDEYAQKKATRSDFLRQAQGLLAQALGETRRPENEITLWDWSLIVAALYKAALAGALLGYTPDPNELRWRLLSVRFDGLGFLSEAHRIPDLLGRKKALEDALDRVKRLLEEEYPLGTEVYRDENGSVFVVPGCEKGHCMDLLKLTDSNGKTLEQLIKGKVLDALVGEIVPQLKLDEEPWWGQDPQWKDKQEKGILIFNDEYPPVAKHLELVVHQPDPDVLAEEWNVSGSGAEVCTVCGLRPQRFFFHIGPEFVGELENPALSESLKRVFQDQGFQLSGSAEVKKEKENEWWITDGDEVYIVRYVSENGKTYLRVIPHTLNQRLHERRICRICDKRRDRRVKDWLDSLETTIWINEVADSNARVALIVGCFDLDHWLNGTLVRTLRVTDPASPVPPKYVPQKIPSFVRLHRIWSTIRGFWQEVAPVPIKVDEGNEEEREKYISELKRSLVGSVLKQAGPRLEIHGSLQGGAKGRLVRFHVYELVLKRQVKLSVVWNGKHFITCDNLDYLESERQLGCPVKEALSSSTTVRVEQPLGYGAQNKYIGEFVVSDVKTLANSEYIPTIPILVEPRTFMALVPAEYAIEIVKEVKAKYEREMGKVRNRLPLHLGVVFAHRRTPLRAILDAGQRLLQQGFPPGDWSVLCAARRSVENGDPLPERFQGDGEDHFREWIEVLLERGDRRLTWYVPLLMGDGQTRDVWYPYVFLKKQSVKPAGRKRAFKAQNPWTREEHWLVHVEDLAPDDVVFFAPATLDWIWLDTNARRFEIAYDERGQRRSPKLRHRPYLLDELEMIEYIWQTLETHLHRNQIHILREMIEAKGEAWGYPSSYDEAFRRFCRDLLAEAEWHEGSREDAVPENRRGRLPWEADGLKKSEWLERWADYAARGWLADAVELYGEILKGGREREPVREVERI